MVQGAKGSLRVAAMGLAMVLFGPSAWADHATPRGLFEAIADGAVRADYIAKNATGGTLQIENLFPEAIVIRLPEAFAARPVLGQFGAPANFGGGPAGANGMGNNAMGNNAAGGQQVGGNFGNRGGGNQNGLDFFGGQGFGANPGFGGNQGLGAGGGGNRMVGGLMRIGPQATARRSAQTVCLQYGKPDPRPRMRYEVVPIEDLTSDPVINRLCRGLGHGSLSSNVAQAIAWHRLDAMDFDTLAALPRHRSRYLRPEPMFDEATLSDARTWLHRCLGSMSETNFDSSLSLASE